MQAWDRYAYANNSPVVYNDPNGHCVYGATANSTGINWAAACSSIGDYAYQFAARVYNSVATSSPVAGNVSSTLASFGAGYYNAAAGYYGSVYSYVPPAATAFAQNGSTTAPQGVSGAGEPAFPNGEPPRTPKTNSKGEPYPEVVDPRTGKPIPAPPNNLQRIPEEQRVPWGKTQRTEFIRQWYENGYLTPEGGWRLYEIHHVIPRAYGGTNEFWNLVPVLQDIHQNLLNPWWQYYGE